MRASSPRPLLPTHTHIHTHTHTQRWRESMQAGMQRKRQADGNQWVAVGCVVGHDMRCDANQAENYMFGTGRTHGVSGENPEGSQGKIQKRRTHSGTHTPAHTHMDTHGRIRVPINTDIHVHGEDRQTDRQAGGQAERDRVTTKPHPSPLSALTNGPRCLASCGPLPSTPYAATAAAHHST